MSRLTVLGLAVVLGVVPASLQAAGNAEQGKAKAVFCTGCHGADGSVEVPMVTGGKAKLAGMDTEKFIAAMKSYRYYQRFHPLMQFFVLPLTEQDMEDFAAYYAGLGKK